VAGRVEYAPGCPGAADYQQLAATLAAEWDGLLARRSAAEAKTVVRTVAASAAEAAR
jgi:hypothetical protein